MKRLLLSFALVSILVAPALALAQDNTNAAPPPESSLTQPSPADLPQVGAPPVDSGIVTGIANTAISALAGKYTWVGQAAAMLCLIMGGLRFAVKPIMLIVEYVIKSTPSTKDDEALEKFERGAMFKWAMWIIDWLSSIKAPTAPTTNPLVK